MVSSPVQTNVLSRYTQNQLYSVEEYVSPSTPMATGYDDVNERNARLKDIAIGTTENGGQPTEVLLIQLIGESY